MDPDATLADIRQLLSAFDAAIHMDDAYAVACDLKVAMEALDNWIMAGGFLPADWAPR